MGNIPEPSTPALPAEEPERLDPQERFVAEAAKASDDDLRSFRPTPAHEKLAEHLFTSQASSFLQLAESSGVDRTTIWRTLKNAAAAKWIVSQATGAVEFGLGAVHARLLHMALTSRSPSFIELYLRRFDPEFKKGGEATHSPIHAQFAQIIQMSPTELEAFVRLKRRKEGLAESREEPQRPGA